MAFGDWGEASPDRKVVADAMARCAAGSAEPFDAALVLGDNFYVPLRGPNDPVFKSFFEDTYDAKRLDFPFYVVLGNHDYETVEGHHKYEWEMRYAVDHPRSRWKLPSRWYRLDLPAGRPLVTLLMLDSDKENGPRGSLLPVEWKDQRDWLEGQLAGPRARWTVCCAHHTVYSNGVHGDNGVLQREWGTLFEKYKVDFYLGGHDHSLQHIDPPGLFTSFVVSGGGGAARKAMMRDGRGYSRCALGFATLSFSDARATVRIIAADGAVLHAFTRDKDGKVAVTTDSPSEIRVTNPLRLLQGFTPATTRATE